MSEAAGSSALAKPRGEAVTRDEAEEFLVREAKLLDEWRLDEWLNLFAADATYLVPALDLPLSEPRQALFLIADDRRRLESRVKQLLGPSAWAERPHSRTRRFITNVLVTPLESGAYRLEANFAVWRFRNEKVDTYVGRYDHELVRGEKGLLLRVRKAILDHESLRPHGSISFIL